MNDLIRPSLYDSWHEIKRVTEDLCVEGKAYDVVVLFAKPVIFLVRTGNYR